MFRAVIIAAALLAPSLAEAASRPAQTFDPARDYELTALCFATYLSLTPSFFTGSPTEMEDLNIIAYRGFQRLKPYAGKAREWAPAFEGGALEYQRGWDREMTALTNENDRNRVRTQIRAFARACDAAMESWGAPVFVGNPPS